MDGLWGGDHVVVGVGEHQRWDFGGDAAELVLVEAGSQDGVVVGEFCQVDATFRVSVEFFRCDSDGVEDARLGQGVEGANAFLVEFGVEGFAEVGVGGGVGDGGETGDWGDQSPRDCSSTASGSAGGAPTKAATTLSSGA